MERFIRTTSYILRLEARKRLERLEEERTSLLRQFPDLGRDELAVRRPQRLGAGYFIRRRRR